MRRTLISTVLALLAALVSSCRVVESVSDFFLGILHDDDIVATVGEHKLYKGELEAMIPAGLSSADSLAYARQCIDTWASELVFLDMAEIQLTKEERNLSKEVEEYRRSLLKYRYEQLYVDSHLDTQVSDDEVQSYYDSHKSELKLLVPAVKARFVSISTDYPALEQLRKKMASDDEEDLFLVDSLARSFGGSYTDYSQNWTDMTTLASAFGVDYGTLLSQMKKSFIEVRDDYGRMGIAYVKDYLRAGAVPPLEYCANEIREQIISVRRQKLVSTLEQDLLEEARANKQFVIYQDTNE